MLTKKERIYTYTTSGSRDLSGTVRARKAEPPTENTIIEISN
jgi:hypothetical protein